MNESEGLRTRDTIARTRQSVIVHSIALVLVGLKNSVNAEHQGEVPSGPVSWTKCSSMSIILTCHEAQESGGSL